MCRGGVTTESKIADAIKVWPGRVGKNVPMTLEKQPMGYCLILFKGVRQWNVFGNEFGLGFRGVKLLG
jgi:hypothetical protein